MNKEPIKIGRISLGVERLLGLSLTADVNIYVMGDTLDQMAQCHPSSYLLTLEKVEDLIKEPDFLHWSEARDSLEYVKVFYVRRSLQPFGVTVIHSGTPKKWHLESFHVLTSDEIFHMAKEGPFQRFENLKKAKD